MNREFYSVLADAILIMHFGIVAFIVLGFVVIWVGFFLKWNFVRNIYFRIAHLLAMGIVVCESWLGVICPLTEWESKLRFLAGETQYTGSFIQHWLQPIIFYEVSQKTFGIIYTLFFMILILTIFIVPPKRVLKSDR